MLKNLSRFPKGFDDYEDENPHAELLRYLNAELGDFMAPDWLGRSVTLNDLWATNRTLIVTYSHDPSSAFSDKLWSEVRHVWGDQENPTGLRNFLGGKFPSLIKNKCAENLQQKLCPEIMNNLSADTEAMSLRRWARYPWAAMTHLTPTKLGVFLNPTKGVRELADSIARNVSISEKLVKFDHRSIYSCF